MANALTVYDQFNELQRAATALYQSGFFPDVKSQAQAIVKVMAGAELGLPPFASMTGVHIIQGKPVLGANVLATLVKNDPRYDYQIKQATNETCELEWFESGSVGKIDRKVGESSFTMKEAQGAGLTNKDNWKKYPSDMLFARAISRGARRFAPGIFGGSPIYTPDELGADIDEDGNVIVDSVAVDAEPETIPDAEPEPEPKPAPSDGSVFDAIVEAGYSDNTHAAKALMQNYCKTGYDTVQKAVDWARLYRGWKDSGLNTVEAADLANAGKAPK